MFTRLLLYLGQEDPLMHGKLQIPEREPHLTTFGTTENGNN